MPFHGQTFRTDTYVPLKLVVDHALSLPQVDGQKLAAYGISGGGLFVPQAAQHDERIKAIAMNSAVVDAHVLFGEMPAAVATAEQIKAWSSFHGSIVRAICWRYGVETPAQLIEANQGNTFDPAKIKAPAPDAGGPGRIPKQGSPAPAKNRPGQLPQPPQEDGDHPHG